MPMNASSSEIRQPDCAKGLADPGPSSAENKEKRPVVPPRLTRVGRLPEVTTQLVGTFSP